jgi:hypothetical protein
VTRREGGTGAAPAEAGRCVADQRGRRHGSTPALREAAARTVETRICRGLAVIETKDFEELLDLVLS